MIDQLDDPVLSELLDMARVLPNPARAGTLRSACHAMLTGKEAAVTPVQSWRIEAGGLAVFMASYALAVIWKALAVYGILEG